MREHAKHIGVFNVWDNPGYDSDEIKTIIQKYGLDGLSRKMKAYLPIHNLLMASAKLDMANLVYPSIDKLVITSQTTTPVDSETSYSGTIYTTVAADEYYRSGNGNPYQVGWNIQSNSANGNWGSFVLITSTGTMINRAIANVTKTSGTAKLVLFTGTVV